MSLILGIAGEMLSGKSTAAQFYTKECAAISFRYSGIINEILDVLDLEQTRFNQQEMGRILKEQFGPTVFAHPIVERTKLAPGKFYLVDGFRTKEEVEIFRSLQNFKLLYISASSELRYTRLRGRAEKVGENQDTLEQFNHSQQHAVDKDISELKSCADIIIENDGSLEDFRAKLKAVEGIC